MIEEIRELYAYDRWANDRILNAAAQLSAEAFTRDLGSSFPSVRDTLAHIIDAEWIWLRRWQGDSPSGPPALEYPDVAAFRSRWQEVAGQIARFLDGLTDEDLARTLTYTDLRGVQHTGALAPMLRHVVNHSTYHRGQVVTMLRQLGAATVSTDLIRFYREDEAKAHVS